MAGNDAAQPQPPPGVAQGWFPASGATTGSSAKRSRDGIPIAQFIDYDKIDQVERDEEDAQQIMVQQTQEDGGISQADTLESQSRVQSKENYLPQIHKMSILEKLEQVFEQSLQRDIYDTMHNQFKIQVNNLKKQEA